MEINDQVFKIIKEHKAKAAHWRSAHYDTARSYQLIDGLIGIPSVILAAGILGFAFYAVDRPNAPIWTQYTLAALTVLQGILSAIQLYIRPGLLYESYRASAINFGSTQRMWMALEQRILMGKSLDQAEFDAVLKASDQATREARPVPARILRRCGIDPAVVDVVSPQVMNTDQ